jgi:hypothetical protein
MITPEEFQRRTAAAQANRREEAVLRMELVAEILDDTEKTRIANENRLRQMTRGTEDKDGRERGLGMDERHPDVAKVADMVSALQAIENDATRLLMKTVKEHPLGPWVMAQKGVGLKQGGRLLASIGNPYLREWVDKDYVFHREPRTVSQLWSFCGHGDASRRPKKGMSQAEMFALGNPDAKMRVYLVAESIMKARGPLRETYDARKAATEGRLHRVECRRCGPSGSPAKIDSPWSDAHRHADALRLVGKSLLFEMWVEAKRLRDGEPVAVAAA